MDRVLLYDDIKVDETDTDYIEEWKIYHILERMKALTDKPGVLYASGEPLKVVVNQGDPLKVDINPGKAFNEDGELIYLPLTPETEQPARPARTGIEIPGVEGTVKYINLRYLEIIDTDRVTVHGGETKQVRQRWSYEILVDDTEPTVGDKKLCLAKVTKGLTDLTIEDKRQYFSVNIIDGLITTEKIADNAVTTEKIADQNVTQEKLSNDSVGTDQVIDENITQDKMAPNSVGASQIIDGNVITQKLADGSVVTPKIADGNVTQQKMAYNSVGNPQLINGNVSQSKLSSYSVGTDQLINGNVTTEKIADYDVTYQKIDPNALGQIKYDARIQNSELRIEARSNDPSGPATGRIWLRTDL